MDDIRIRTHKELSGVAEKLKCYNKVVTEVANKI